MRRHFLLELLVLLAGMIVFSILVRTYDLDLLVSEQFHRYGETPDWWGKDRQPWQALYDYGAWPAILVGIVSILGLIGSLWRSVLRRYRRSFLFLLFTLVLGPGVLINMGFKDHWGRPRPREVVEFGGPKSFQPLGEIGVAGKGKSFPSGHASIGFYFVGMYLLWRRRHPRAARAGLIGGLIGGGLIGFQRIAVGGHFLSDVVWAGGVVTLTGLCVDAALPRERPGHEPERLTNRWVLSAIGLGILAAALLATPSYQRVEEAIGPFPRDSIARIRWEPVGSEPAQGTIDHIDAGRYLLVRTEIQGYGHFENEFGHALTTAWSADTLAVTLRVSAEGFFTRLKSAGSYEIVSTPPEATRPVPYR